MKKIIGALALSLILLFVSVSCNGKFSLNQTSVSINPVFTGSENSGVSADDFYWEYYCDYQAPTGTEEDVYNSFGERKGLWPISRLNEDSTYYFALRAFDENRQLIWEGFSDAVEVSPAMNPISIKMYGFGEGKLYFDITSPAVGLTTCRAGELISVGENLPDVFKITISRVGLPQKELSTGMFEIVSIGGKYGGFISFDDVTDSTVFLNTVKSARSLVLPEGEYDIEIQQMMFTSAPDMITIQNSAKDYLKYWTVVQNRTGNIRISLEKNRSLVVSGTLNSMNTAGSGIAGTGKSETAVDVSIQTEETQAIIVAPEPSETEIEKTSPVQTAGGVLSAVPGDFVCLVWPLSDSQPTFLIDGEETEASELLLVSKTGVKAFVTNEPYSLTIRSTDSEVAYTITPELTYDYFAEGSCFPKDLNKPVNLGSGNMKAAYYGKKSGQSESDILCFSIGVNVKEISHTSWELETFFNSRTISTDGEGNVAQKTSEKITDSGAKLEFEILLRPHLGNVTVSRGDSSYDNETGILKVRTAEFGTLRVTSDLWPYDNGLVPVDSESNLEGELYDLLSDEESFEDFTSKNWNTAPRRWTVNKPLTFNIKGSSLIMNNYFLEPLSGVQVWAEINKKERVLILSLDYLEPLSQGRFGIYLFDYSGYYQDENGNQVFINRLSSSDKVELHIKCENPLYREITSIKTDWNCFFSSGQTGSWLKMTPLHAREWISQLTNFAWVLSQPEVEYMIIEKYSSYTGADFKQSASLSFSSKVDYLALYEDMLSTRFIALGLTRKNMGLGGNQYLGCPYETFVSSYKEGSYILSFEIGRVLGFDEDSDFCYGTMSYDKKTEKNLLPYFHQLYSRLGNLPYDAETTGFYKEENRNLWLVEGTESCDASLSTRREGLNALEKFILENSLDSNLSLLASKLKRFR